MKNSICTTYIVSLFHVCSLWIRFLVDVLCLSAFRFLHKFIFLLACNRCNQIKPNELNTTQFEYFFFEYTPFPDRCAWWLKKRRGNSVSVRGGFFISLLDFILLMLFKWCSEIIELFSFCNSLIAYIAMWMRFVSTSSHILFLDWQL